MLAIILLVLSVDCGTAAIGQSLNVCGDWISYKNEKCFKFLNKLGTEDEAKNNCFLLDRTATLIDIESADEQEFLNNQLKKYQSIADKCWLGMNIHQLVVNPWNMKHRYTNWAEGSAELIGYQTCVQMSLSNATLGKWTDEPCRRKGLIACQRRQQWTVDSLRDIMSDILDKINSQNAVALIEEQKEVIEKLKKSMETQLNSILAQNGNIEAINKTIDRKVNKIFSELAKNEKKDQNCIPIGFIYFELPNQMDPKTIWPSIQWKDITEEYSGLFFRAEGNNSLAFGKIQEPNCTVISNVMSSALTGVNFTKQEGRQYQLKEGWSTNLVPGLALSDFYIHLSNGETRPRNTAIRIWKRVA